jgi:hypothetical protein
MSSPIEANSKEALLALASSAEITREQSKHLMSFADLKVNLRLADNHFVDSETLDELLELPPTDPLHFGQDTVKKIGENPNTSQETLWKFCNDKTLRKKIAYNPSISDKMALILIKENSSVIDIDLASNPGLSESLYTRLFRKYKRKDELIMRSLSMNSSIPEKIAVKLSAHPRYNSNVMRYARVAESIFFKVNVTDREKLDSLHSMLSNPYVTDAFSSRIYEEYFNKEPSDRNIAPGMARAFFTHPGVSKDIFYKVKESNIPDRLKLILANPNLPVGLVEEIFSNPILKFHNLDDNPEYVDRYEMIDSLNVKLEFDVYSSIVKLMKENVFSSEFIKRCLTTDTFIPIQIEACRNSKADKEDIKECISHWFNKINSLTSYDAKFLTITLGIILDREQPVYEIFKDMLKDDYDLLIDGMPDEMVLQLLGWQ